MTSRRYCRSTVALTNQQIRTIMHLLDSRSDSAAAIAAGVTPRALRNWMLDPEFCKALAEERARLFDSVRNRIASAATTASKRLLELIDNPNLPLSELIDLIKYSLSVAISENDKQVLMGRLAALEAGLKHNATAEPWEEAGPVIEGSSKSKQLN